MNLSDKTNTRAESAHNPTVAVTVLAREAGLPFQPPLGSASGLDPIAEWLSLMEVVQMLCPAWQVRDKPMTGDHWRI